MGTCKRRFPTTRITYTDIGNAGAFIGPCGRPRPPGLPRGEILGLIRLRLDLFHQVGEVRH